MNAGALCGLLQQQGGMPRTFTYLGNKANQERDAVSGTWLGFTSKHESSLKLCCSGLRCAQREWQSSISHRCFPLKRILLRYNLHVMNHNHFRHSVQAMRFDKYKPTGNYHYNCDIKSFHHLPQFSCVIFCNHCLCYLPLDPGND